MGGRNGAVLGSVRVSMGSKASLVLSENLKGKLSEIDTVVEQPLLMLGMTGYNDYRELASALFQVLAVLEIVC